MIGDGIGLGWPRHRLLGTWKRRLVRAVDVDIWGSGAGGSGVLRGLAVQGHGVPLLGATNPEEVEHDACDDEEHDAARRGDHPPSQLKLPVLAFGMEALGVLQGIVPGDLVAVIPPIGLRHLAGKGHGYGDLGAAADVLGGELGVLRAEFAQGAGGQIEDIPPVLVLDRPRVGFELVDRD